MKLFEMTNVIKKYGSRTVLNVPQLQLGQDLIYAILGPNGAGKTTLLRLLNLLTAPDSGQLKFMGVDTAASEATRLAMSRQMCMVFQKPYMFRTSVYNNVAYGLKLRKTGAREIRKRVMEALDFVGMASFAARHAFKLSGGETQRVALARALALRPRVLLLDEPTANLDPASVQAIERIIRNSRDQYGTSVIMVTHNLFQAKRIADQTILLFDGQVVEQQATNVFFTAPKDERTRRFLDGTMVY
ncbi:MAG: phosphate ABC transporter ATP-binding protein [Syntrophomonadaceae bacterium]|nr:phosphate ABC transporter ATP-binding protein [Syntrophomonadaceae bacterium]